MSGAGRRRSSLIAGAVVAAVILGVAWPAAGRSPSPPPPTPVAGSPSPFPTVLHTPKLSAEPPRVQAPEAILEDFDSGQVLFRKRPLTRHPIASLTKIMTALLVLQRTDPTDMVEVSARAASQGGSVLGLRTGERISVRNLLYALLLQSANDAAVALAETVSESVERFILLMNREARAMGLRHTRFYSPSGLDDRGYSTPADLARLTRTVESIPEFARVVRSRFRTIPAPEGPDRRVQNRNVLLWLYPGAVGVKTGFTTPAGHCVVALAERGGRHLVVVVLGAVSEDAQFGDGAALLNYGFAGFVESTLLHAGQPIGSVTLDGHPVEVVAGASLERLVPGNAPVTAGFRLIPSVGLGLPIAAGRKVGNVVVFVGGRRVGIAPALAASAVDVGGKREGAPVGRQPLDDVAEVLDLMLQSVFGAFL